MAHSVISTRQPRRRENRATAQGRGQSADGKQCPEAVCAPNKARAQKGQGSAFERQHEKQHDDAEGAQPRILHDFKPPFPRRFDKEAVAAVGYAIQMQTPSDGNPDQAGTQAAERRGQQRRAQPQRAGHDQAHDQAHGGHPGHDTLKRCGGGGRTQGQAGKKAECVAEHQ